MIEILTIGYIGPGAGVSLIWALVALLMAIGSAFLFLILWPLRMMIKRIKGKAADVAGGDPQETATPEV